MKVLIVGDIVGKSGMDRLKIELPKYIKNETIEFSIVNGENSANGKGLRIKEYNEILSYGADAITMGNHVYYRKEMAEEYIRLPRLLLPANITNLNGNGSIIVEKNNIKYGIVNIIGAASMGTIFESNTTNPFLCAEKEVNELKKKNVDYIFIDFHSEVTAEKQMMGYFLEDKGVTCMFGTHTHIQTADEKILNGKMAYINDIGMTGPSNSVLGLTREIAYKRFVDGQYAKYECSTNKAIFNAVIVEIDENRKIATKITRINE